MNEKEAAGVALTLASFLAVCLIGIAVAPERGVSSGLLDDGANDGRATWSESHETSLTVDGYKYSADYSLTLRYDLDWKTGQKHTVGLEVRIDDTSSDNVSLSLAGRVDIILPSGFAVAWMWSSPYLEKGEHWNGSFSVGFTPIDAGIKSGETTTGSIWLVFSEIIRVTHKGEMRYSDARGKRSKASPDIILGTPPPAYDLVLTIKDFTGIQTLVDAEVDVTDPLEKTTRHFTKNGVLAVEGLREGTYRLTVWWKSPYDPVAVPVGSYADRLSQLKKRGELRTNVFDITVTVKDTRGRPAAGATIETGSVTHLTDSLGKAIFPLMPEGHHAVYVTKYGRHIGMGSIDVVPGTTSLEIIVEPYDLTVRVVGEQGQELPHATVVIDSFSKETDVNGRVTFSQIAAGDYTVAAYYKNFAGTAIVSEAEIRAGESVVIKLPPYTEIFGVVLTFWTFISIITLAILLIVATVAWLFIYRPRKHE